MNESDSTNDDAKMSTQQQSATGASSKPPDLKELLNFKEILQLFNCAISQEQAWAVLYQILSKFKQLLDEENENLELIKLNQDKIDINVLNFAKDGSLIFGFQFDYVNYFRCNKNMHLTSSSASSLLSSNLEQERTCLESKVLKSVAYLIYDALDYGNNYSNEPVLETGLSNLLLLTSGHFKEFSKSRVLNEDDEGYDQDEEDSISLDKAIEICINNVAYEDADYHYKAVCRGLYAQAFELKAFLAKIEDSKNILQKSGKDTTHYCFEVLDKTDWAKLWMQVIHELRHGVKLRKVGDSYIMRRNIEYELTPFEILLDQIRARRYHLKKVQVDALNNELKKDARDIILEFIRSRPPLRKSSLRNFNNSKIKFEPKLNLHEQLMNSIRNYSTPLRKISIQLTESNNNDSIKEANFYKYTDEKLNQSSLENKRTKRLLKPDKKLLNNLTSSDDDESDIDYDEIKNLPTLEDEYNNLINASSFLNNASTTNVHNQSRLSFNMNTSSLNNSQRNKRRIKAPDSLKSPLAPWIDPVENWRALVTEDILIENAASNTASSKQINGNKKQITNHNQPNRRHTMNLADIQSMSNNLTSLNIFSGAFGGQSQRKQIKKLTSGVDSLKLTFDELCHIRNVLTKAELDYLLFDNQLFQDVSKGRVCFSCRKTKFHLFNWGCKCRICQQRVCKKCLRNAQLKNGQIAQVPLFKLCPSKFSIHEQANDDEMANNNKISHNSNSSMSSGSQTTTSNEDEMVVVSSSDTTSNNNKDNLYLISSATLFTSSSSSNTMSNEANTKILDICVDCYQMMDGVSVSLNSSTANQKNETMYNEDGDDDEEEEEEEEDFEDEEDENSETFSGGSSSPAESIKMNSLTNINHVNTENLTKNKYKTPLVNKILPSLTSNTCHSTPTPTALNINSVNDLTLDANQDLLCNIENHQRQTSTSSSKQHLTLNLQPVYSNSSAVK